MAGRAKSWTGEVAELAAAIEPAARSKPFFVKPIKKGDNEKWSKILANRDMWVRLKALHPGLSFKAGDVLVAMRKVLDDVKQGWKSPALTPEQEDDWVLASSERLR